MSTSAESSKDTKRQLLDAQILNAPLEALPQQLRGTHEDLMMGIDEAGRGPTLGPMVYGAAIAPVSRESDLRKMGFDDSKQLTETKRDELWAATRKCGWLGWKVRVLHAAEISGGRLRRHKPYNLNAQSHDAAIGMVRWVLEQGVNLRHLYVDTVGDPAMYKAKLESIFPNLQITVAPKADSLYPIVSAASICAKVPRDTILANWRFEDAALCQDRDWGCGYPGDDACRAWLKRHLQPIFGYPDVVRFCWGPIAEVLEKNPDANGACVVRWPDDEEDPSLAWQRESMAAFLGKRKRAAVERHKVYGECDLEAVEGF